MKGKGRTKKKNIKKKEKMQILNQQERGGRVINEILTIIFFWCDVTSVSWSFGEEILENSSLALL